MKPIPTLDSGVLAEALTRKIDEKIMSDSDLSTPVWANPEDMFVVLLHKRREATVSLLTQLIMLLPDTDRECIVKLFKLHPDVI